MHRTIRFGWQCSLLSCLRMAAGVLLLAGHSHSAQPQSQSTPGALVPLPLASHLNTWFSNSPPPEGWSQIPTGRQSFHDSPFEVWGRMEVTGMEAARLGDSARSAITGIRVEGRARRLFLLHGAVNRAKDGTPMANLVLHYANGQRRSLRLAYGVHARSWMKEGTERQQELDDPNSMLVWTGMSGGGEGSSRPLRLFRTVFENPLPDVAMRSIDFVSLFSDATPFLVAITLDLDGRGPPTLIPANSRRLVKKAHEHDDEIYRKQFFVQAVDAQSGAAISNAAVSLTVTDDEFPFFFGETRTASNGAALIDYPPQHTVSYALQVAASDYVPALLTGSRTNRRAFPAEITARLERGIRIGGVVTNKSGQPVSEARVSVHKIHQEGPTQFTRIDYVTIETDREGKWSTSSLPADLALFQFEITHPQYRPTIHSVASTNWPLVLDDLRAGKAALALAPAPRFEGLVVDRAGHPVPRARVYLHDSSDPQPLPARLGETDDAGRFVYVTSDPMEAGIFILADGFAPKFYQVHIGEDDRSARIQLAPKRVFRGRVQDQSQRPIEGVLVKVDSWQNCQLITWHGETDSEGRFAWDGAPEGAISFNLSKTNFHNSRYSMSGSPKESRFTLRRMIGVSGLVLDADTKKPIEEFTVIRGYTYNQYNPFRWQRSDSTRGRNGRYTMRLYEYSSDGYTKILVEAPGYLPAASPEFRKPDWYTNNFELKKGRGISGVVQLPTGEPVNGVSVTLVESSDYAYMDKSGQFRSGRSYGELVRTDAQGRFELPAKLDPHTILAAHDKGYAEVSASEVAANGKVILRPWGAIKGVLRVGPEVESDQLVVLNSWHYSYGDGQRSSPPLSLALKTIPAADGSFLFERVPPGERKVELEYKISGRRYFGGVPRSHGLPVNVRPGETAEIVIGGTGRTVRGKIRVVGATPDAVDWLRDTHTLSLNVPNPEVLTQPDMSTVKTDAERQQIWRDQEQLRRASWQTEKGRRLDRQRRSYVLLFDTNGAFRAHHVPPGNYSLNITVSDPEEDDGSYRQIGYLHSPVEVAEATGPDAAKPIDIGTLEMRVTASLRVGQRAPDFEAKTFNGQPVKLAAFRGKTVLLEFWSTWAGSREGDLANLKSLYETYGKDPRFVMIGLNLDHEIKPAEEFLRNNELKWLQCYIGPWNQSPIRDSFGIQGVPAAVVIDSEGQVVAKNIYGSSIRTAVRNALSSSSRANTR